MQPGLSFGGRGGVAPKSLNRDPLQGQRKRPLARNIDFQNRLTADMYRVPSLEGMGVGFRHSCVNFHRCK